MNIIVVCCIVQWEKSVPDVQQKVHEVLEGGGDVFAAQTRHVLPHVASEDLIEWRSFLRVIVDILRNLP